MSDLTTAAVNRLATLAGMFRKSNITEPVRSIFSQHLANVLAAADANRESRGASKVTNDDLDAAYVSLGIEWTSEANLDLPPVGKPEEYFENETRAYVTPIANFSRMIKELGYTLAGDAAHNCQYLIETLTIKHLAHINTLVVGLSGRATIKGSDIELVAENFSLKSLTSLEITQPEAPETKVAKPKAKAKVASKPKGSKPKADPSEDEEVEAPKAKASKPKVSKPKKAPVEEEDEEEVPVVKPKAKAAKPKTVAKKAPPPDDDEEVEEDEE